MTGRQGKGERRVEIVDSKRVYEGFFNLEEVRVQFEQFDGTMSPELTRLTVRRQNAAAVLLWRTDIQRLVLVEQFRAATLYEGSGWTVELPAGLLDEGETPAVTMLREIREEAGYEVRALDEVLTYYPSPGSSSERVSIFFAQVTAEDKIGSGGGVDEGEDLQVQEWSVEELRHAMNLNRIVDGKTIIGIQWLLAKLGK